ncbi:hypothetical protein [Litchfieldia alkalitelluris]|uniref:hypothetical protein n=1 Tax=Litchfieldia alkalitelluris TaxID=304268 RepID=UPI000995F99F|nr:hypothetical protein [Litchfieldia alkalitelluris]
MRVQKKQLIELVKKNNNVGIIEINQIPYEVRLLDDSNFQFTGVFWDWEETQIPSSHHDYLIETDELVLKHTENPPSIEHMNEFDYYRNIKEI